VDIYTSRNQCKEGPGIPTNHFVISYWQRRLQRAGHVVIVDYTCVSPKYWWTDIPQEGGPWKSRKEIRGMS